MDKAIIKKELQALGVSPALLGYHYLAESIYIVKDHYSKGNVTIKVTCIYKQVAKKFNSSASRVERAIRNAIEIAFERGPRELLEKFGYLSSISSGKITNSCFICTIAEQLVTNQTARG